MSKQSTVMIISPHPDDLEIGMGGTAARAVAEGQRVISVVLTDGRRSPRSFSCSDDEMAQIRHQEVTAAATVLGLSKLICFDLNDLKSEANCAALCRQLLTALDHYQPDQLYLPHPQLDRHESHRRAAQQCLAVIDSWCERNPLEIWAYEVWGLFPHWDRVVDISEYLASKIAAIDCHRSQVTDVAYAEGVIGLNRWRGVFQDPHNIPAGRYLEAFIKIVAPASVSGSA